VEPARRLRGLLETKAQNTNADTLPIETFDRVKALMKAEGVSHRRMAQLRGTSYGGAAHFRFAPSRATALEYAALLHDPVLAREATSDLFWDRLVEIEPAGEEEVYDLTVPGPASWLADGIVSHNSGAIEQDADCVLFIHKEPDAMPNGVGGPVDVELIIAKQRNGPTGGFPLVFMSEYTRFENAADTEGGGPPP
jgi:replicative DNA helicase